MLLTLPGLWLLADITIEDPIVHVLQAGCAQRGVVQIHQSKRGFYVGLKLMQRLELVRSRRHAAPAWGFQKHLVTAVQ